MNTPTPLIERDCRQSGNREEGKTAVLVYN